MKKTISILSAALIILALIGLVGCSNKNASSGSEGGDVSKYETAVDVLAAVVETYSDEQKFPIGGGDSENMVMDAPGKVDISKTEELDISLGLPDSQTANIDDAASMIHMMNTNIFTGAAYHLADDTDLTAFADAVKENIMAKHWLCGMPDTLIIISVPGQYVVTAYGYNEIIETFKSNALSSLDGSKIILEEPIIENY